MLRWSAGRARVLLGSALRRGRLAFFGAMVASLLARRGVAEARSHTVLMLQVDLRTGATKTLYRVSVARSETQPRAAPPAGWWRRTAGGHQPELKVRVEEPREGGRAVARDSSRAEPGTKPNALLVVLADEREGLRLPLRLASTEAWPSTPSWDAVEGKMLVVGWSGVGGERLGVDLERGAVAWRMAAPSQTKAHATGDLLGVRAAGQGRLLGWDRSDLVALNAATGAEVWRQPSPGNGTSLPFTWCGDESAQRWVVSKGNLFAVDATSGRELWRAQLGAAPAQRGKGQASWCLVRGDRVVVAWEEGAPPARKSTLVALDARDGHELWKTEAGDLATGTWAGPDALAVWSGDQLRRVEGATGRVVWTLPAVAAPEVEVLGNGDWFLPRAECARVDARDGKVLWKLGAPCARQSEKVLLTVAQERRDLSHAEFSLVQHAFATRKVLRRDVIYRGRDFFDIGSCEVVDTSASAATVRCDFTVLD